MLKQQTIKCAFCQGTGQHPHFTGACPVCKGKGKNQVIGRYMACSDCGGTGQKRGTTLVCWTCRGLGVVPDTREEFKKARKEIKKAREEMAKERLARRSFSEGREEFREPTEKSSGNTCFCQACAKKVEKGSTLKVCLECFKKIKKL